MQLKELLNLLLLLLVSQKLSFVVDDAKSINLVNWGFEFIDLFILFVDELIEAEKDKELLFDRVEQLENILAVVQLIDINLHTLKRRIHSQLQLLWDWELAVETIRKQVTPLELTLTVFASTFVLL